MVRKFEIIDSLKLKPKSVVADAESLLGDIQDSNGVPTLRVRIDATHSGRLTNSRVYPGKFMKKSVKSFLDPYAKPVLRHHDDEQDAIGRIAEARYMQLKRGDEFYNDYKNPGKGLGSGFIQLTADISDPDAIRKFIDGRYQQVSTRQGFSQLNCSICGSDYASAEPCDHYPGRQYSVEGSKDRKASKYLCYGITGPLSYREVSVVNIPGDDEAKITNFEMIHSDSEEPFVMYCGDDELFASVDSLVLSDGSETVDLTATANKSCVSSGDRKKLTSKSIIAISPLFIPDKLLEIHEEEINMKTLQEDLPEAKAEVEEPKASGEITQNTTEEAASLDSGQEPSTEDATEAQEEGVIAPTEEEVEDSAESATEPSLSDEVLRASLEAVAKSLKDAEAEVKNISAELQRAKNTISEKEDEVTRTRQAHTDCLVELKSAYSTTLLNTRISLGKADVAHVKDQESFNEQLEKYALRTIDSLKDSILDLGVELAEQNPSHGVVSFAASKVAEDKVESPVSNQPAKEAKVRTSRVTKESALEELFG